MLDLSPVAVWNPIVVHGALHETLVGSMRRSVWGLAMGGIIGPDEFQWGLMAQNLTICLDMAGKTYGENEKSKRPTTSNADNALVSPG